MNHAKLLNELARDEGLRLEAYICPAGKLTIGYGHNLEDNPVTLHGVRYDKDTKSITKEEAELLLMHDIGAACADLSRSLPWWDQMSDARKRGLVNMCFNLGLGRLLRFRKMIQALASAQYDVAAKEALNSKWARQVGDRARRIAGLFLKG